MILPISEAPMMETASQVLHRLASAPTCAGSVALFDSLCWVCGGRAARGLPVHRWMGATFTDQNRIRAPHASHVCEGCVFVMSGRPPDSARLWTHLVEGDRVQRANKADKAGIRTFLRRTHAEPWFAGIADSGKKHVLPWVPVNTADQTGGRVLLEGRLVELPRDGSGWGLVDDITTLLTRGATKADVERGDYEARSWARVGAPAIRTFEAAWGARRGGAWFTLALWLAQREDAERETT